MGDTIHSPHSVQKCTEKFSEVHMRLQQTELVKSLEYVIRIREGFWVEESIVSN